MKKKKCFNCDQVLDFAALPAAANGNVTCPGCGESNAPDMEASALACRALAALPEVGSDGALPTDIQLFPPGKDVPFTLEDFPDRNFLADVDEATAVRLDKQLQTMIARASAGTGARPFGDKNHEDAEATFHPTKIFWGGEDPKAGGVRVKTDWTGFGSSLVKARAFGYASGNFRFAPTTKKIMGLLGENIAGLVNRPGFSSIQAFAKANSSNNNQEQKNTMIKEEMLAALTEGLKPFVTRLETLEASAKASIVKDDPTIMSLETRLKNLETEKVTSIEASAKASVAEAVKLGKIASQDKDGIAWWENQIAAEAKAGKAEATVRLQKLPANPAFLQIIHAAAAGDPAANVAEPSAEGFVACVKAHAKAGKKKSEALDLAIKENAPGYKAWRDANGKPGL
jgi:hypothetical protein